MRATLIFSQSHGQYALDADGLENIVKEYTIIRKRNGITANEYVLQSEYPSSVIANQHSEADSFLADAMKRQKQA